MACTPEDCKKFFRDYDERFHPASPKNKLGKEIGPTVEFLLDRVKARADGKAIPKANPAQQAAVKKLCTAQEKLFDDHFKKGTGLDYECIQTCFVRFVNGELRGDPKEKKLSPDDKPREPDGAFMFLFAEFATAAIEAGCDQALWTELLRIFVKAQEIFIQVYPPRKAPGDPFNRPRPYKGPPVGEPEKTRLHDKYKGKTKDEIIDEYKKNLDKANGQKEVAIGLGRPLEEFAFASVGSHLRDVSHLADVVIREAALPYVEAARWQALAAASASLRQLFLLSFHPAPGIQGFLGTVIIDVPLPGSAAPADLASTAPDEITPGDDTGGGSPRDILEIEGIDDALATRLATGAGVRTLADLARLSADEVRVQGIGRQGLREFAAMAKFLTAYEDLSGNDAELLVRGLGLGGPEELASAANEMTPEVVEEAIRRTRLPADYEPSAILRLFRGSSG